MTIDQMRAVLGLDETVSDADVADAYTAYLLSLVTPAEPISLEEAKAQLGILDDNDDPRITGLIIAARRFAENYTGLILIAREVTQQADRFGSWLDLYHWPVRELTSITYLDSYGAVQTLDTTGYIAMMSRRPVRLAPAINSTWPTAANIPGGISITYQAGYESAEDVPEEAKQAMLLLIRHWYDNSSAVVAGTSAGAVQLPFGVTALLDPLRDRTC